MQHDRIVDTLEQRLKDSDSYDLILSCKKYKVYGKDGECDVIALRPPYAVVFEVKGQDRSKGRRKAIKQLKKDMMWIRDRYPHIERIFTFYAYSRNKDIVSEWYMNL